MALTPGPSNDESEDHENIRHEIYVNFQLLVFACIRCGRSYETLSEAVESHDTEDCVPLSTCAPMDSFVFVNFPFWNYVCFGCGAGINTFEEALTHTKPGKCVRSDKHVIFLDFQSKKLFHCRECGGTFGKINEAIDHWKNENFPRPELFTELPAKHMMSIDAITGCFVCATGNEKFKSVNGAWAHWSSKHATRLQLQNSWIDFNNETMICGRCGQVSESFRNAQKHSESHSPVIHDIGIDLVTKSMSCCDCSEELSSLRDAVEHTVIDTFFVSDEDVAVVSGHDVVADFSSKQIRCDSCKLSLKDLKKALVHIKSQYAGHYIKADYDKATMKCDGCEENYFTLNDSAKHFKYEMWPLYVKKLQISSKHRIILDFASGEMTCLRCHGTMSTLEEAKKHWKKHKVNKFVKNFFNMTCMASTGPCF